MACPEGPEGVAATLQKEGFAAKVRLLGMEILFSSMFGLFSVRLV